MALTRCERGFRAWRDAALAETSRGSTSCGLVYAVVMRLATTARSP
jgi:hypothetical protein